MEMFNLSDDSFPAVGTDDLISITDEDPTDQASKCHELLVELQIMQDTL